MSGHGFDISGEAQDFTVEVQALAKAASDELSTRSSNQRKRSQSRRRLKRIVLIGGILASLELVALGAQMARHPAMLVENQIGSSPRYAENSCKGAKYRAFQALVQYRRSHGNWPPSLEVLEGAVPVDPSTLRVAYQRTDTGITLRCS